MDKKPYEASEPEARNSSLALIPSDESYKQLLLRSKRRLNTSYPISG